MTAVKAPTSVSSEGIPVKEADLVVSFGFSSAGKSRP
jgi:hypothetical protein